MQHTIVMTGASRGIGYLAALAMLRHAPDLHLLITTRGPGREIAARLAGESGNPHVRWIECDLSSLASVRAAAYEVAGRLDRGDLPALTGFVGNAGVQVTSGNRSTTDGLEMTFAVNVLAHHLFVRALTSSFTAPARVVLTTSDTHFGDLRHNLGMVPAPTWRDPAQLAQPGTTAASDTAAAGRTAYSTSKLALIYLVHELSRRLPTGVDVYSWNPGFVPATGLARDASAVQRFAMARVMPVLALTPLAVTASTAGRHLAAAATSEHLGAPTGAYLNLDAAQPSSEESYDPARERQLWQAAEQLCHLR